jgi:HEAT repeat protein/Mg-chelatase subunit ChlD
MLPTVLLLGLLLGLAPFADRISAQEASDPMEAVRRAGEEVSSEQLHELAATRTPEALEALRRVLDTLANRYAQGVALECLADFVDTPSEEAAFETLLQAATLSPLPELREKALATLASCGLPGRARLTTIVLSEADITVRERALELHVAQAVAEDAPWYEELYRATGKKKVPLYPAPIRELGFAGAAPFLEPAALATATEDPLHAVRRLALDELVRRDDGKAEKCAQKRYGDHEEQPGTRLAAARYLLEKRGPKQAAALFKDATSLVLPPELAFDLADLLRDHLDARLTRSVVKNLGEGQPQERRATLRMAVAIQDEKVDEALAKLAEDPDAGVAIEAIGVMAERGGARHVPQLERLVETADRPAVRAAALLARARLPGDSEAWIDRLRVLSTADGARLRNAAIEALGRLGDARHLDVLDAALDHPDWSTRLAAVKAIELLHVPAGVGTLCEHIAGESSRRVAWELREALWRMTGESLGLGNQWKSWWKDVGPGFTFPPAEEIARRGADRARAEARQVSRSFRGVAVDSRFFGLRVKSNSVAFVVDVSGSMQERLPGSRDEKGPTRIEIARRELLACMEALEAGTRFNIIPFSRWATPWREKAPVLDETSFAEAAAFVADLRPLEATNMMAGLKAAFADENIDTIFLLSDGIPTGATPGEIRIAVRLWNAGRGVVIHTISVGERFPLLRWLAEDTGGEYRTYP